MRPSRVLLCVALLLTCAPTPAIAISDAPLAEQAAAAVPVLPKDMNQVRGLTCPTDDLCVGIAFDGQEDVLVVGTGAAKETWRVVHLPHPAGATTFAEGVGCASASLCFAWGNAGAPTIWVSTAPASGAWQRHVLGGYPGPGTVEDVTCASTGLCVAASDGLIGDQDRGGAAWVTNDITGDSWAGTNLDSVFRLANLDCVGSACVIAGQSEEFEAVQASVWQTTDVLAGGWTRVQPSARNGYVTDSVSPVDCLSVTLCVANAVTALPEGNSVYIRSGYFVSRTPGTGGWDFHDVDADDREPGPLSCRTANQCLVHDLSGVSTDADPADEVAPTSVGIPQQYELRLGGFFCLDATTCLAWGADRGQASAGPSIATRVWRGPWSGGPWSGTTLPVPPGYADYVPVADTLACGLSACTAVGYLVDASGGTGMGTVVWAAGADGRWRVAAASADLGPGGGGEPPAQRVKTRVSRFAVDRQGSQRRLVGRLSGSHGCARSRTVEVMGKHNRPVSRLTSDRHGRFQLRLTAHVRKQLGSTVWVKVPAYDRGSEVRCSAATSSRVHL